MAKILYLIDKKYGEEGLKLVKAVNSSGKHEIGVILIQDGIYLALREKKQIFKLVEEGISFFATKKDVNMRGLSEKIDRTNIKLVEYSELVDLVMEKYEKIISYV